MIISKTPLRISFVGGGSDIKNFYAINDGHVLSTTINKYIYVIVKERFDNDIYVSWSKKKEIVKDATFVEHDLVRESLIKVGIYRSIEITMLADIPSTGTGLGSSSSLTVGLLNALYAYRGIQVSEKRLAEESSQIEIDILNKPIGKQDQYNAAYGGVNHYIFKTDDTVDIFPLKFDANELLILGSNLLLHYTGITRDANIILTDQKKNITNKLDVMNEMVRNVKLLKDELNIKRYDAVGEFLKSNWSLKKELSEGVSTTLIDTMVTESISSGATGCKILGAGGGGFLLSYVPREMQNTFREKMCNYKELPFMLESLGTRIIFNIK